jgi:hypothetical protein
MWSRLRVVLPTAMVMARPLPASYMARSVTTARRVWPSKEASYHWARSVPVSCRGRGSGKPGEPASRLPSASVTLR